MDDTIIGNFYRDDKGELYLRVDDPKWPWRFIDPVAGIMEVRSAGFPHRPLTDLGTLGGTAI